jgi:hypothetical protein
MDDAAMSARLDAIEDHVAEIIRRIDELQCLLTTLDGIQPNVHSTNKD